MNQPKKNRVRLKQRPASESHKLAIASWAKDRPEPANVRAVKIAATMLDEIERVHPNASREQYIAILREEVRQQLQVRSPDVFTTLLGQMVLRVEHKGRTRQGVTVGNVNLECGGQAIVGNVQAGAPRPAEEPTTSSPERSSDGEDTQADGK
jgi:hypothetical protein